MTAGGSMQGTIKERSTQLRKQATVEHDSEELMALIREIKRMLDDKEERVEAETPELLIKYSPPFRAARAQLPSKSGSGQIAEQSLAVPRRVHRSALFGDFSGFISILEQNQKVEFHLSPRDLSMVTENGDIVVPEGKYSVSVGGGQPGGGIPSVSEEFEVNGQIILPE
jgi:hypothetical protein